MIRMHRIQVGAVLGRIPSPIEAENNALRHYTTSSFERGPRRAGDVLSVLMSNDDGRFVQFDDKCVLVGCCSPTRQPNARRPNSRIGLHDYWAGPVDGDPIDFQAEKSRVQGSVADWVELHKEAGLGVGMNRGCAGQARRRGGADDISIAREIDGNSVSRSEAVIAKDEAEIAERSCWYNLGYIDFLSGRNAGSSDRGPGHIGVAPGIDCDAGAALDVVRQVCRINHGITGRAQLGDECRAGPRVRK